jgi:hypothetical protein
MSLVGALALATWVAFFATVATFTVLWRIGNSAPSGAWAVLSIVSVAGTSLAAAAAAARTVIRGPRRLRPASLVLVGFTPIVWSGLFLYDLASRVNWRDSLPVGAVTRVAGSWISSVMDIEARWRYPRWTWGRHVVLIDDGQTPSPEHLTDAMDAHIERMAALLAKPVPNARARWVRGPIVGQHGRAILAWAVCDPGSAHPAELTELDRHEIAHVLITGLGGPDQFPPMVLAEGWAECQCREGDQQIVSLDRDRRLRRTTPIRELIEPDWYGRSQGPAYSEGGPFCRYLIERYGAARFFDLYIRVRPATFRGDCEQILGTRMPALELDFWAWVQVKAKTAPQANAVPFELAPGVSRTDWENLLASCHQANEDRGEWPDGVGIGVDVAFSRPQGRAPALSPAELRVAFAGSEAWLVATQRDGASRFCVMVGHDRAGSVVKDSGGETREAGGISFVPGAREILREAWGFYHLPLTDPRHWLPIDGSNVQGGTRVEEIVPPTPASSGRWKVVLATAALPAHARRTLELDPQFDWHVARESYERDGRNVFDRQTKLQRVGGVVTLAESESVSRDGDGELLTRARTRLLDHHEQAELRREVESTFPPGEGRVGFVRRPLSWGIVWTAIAFGMLGTSLARDRRKHNRRPHCGVGGSVKERVSIRRWISSDPAPP